MVFSLIVQVCSAQKMDRDSMNYLLSPSIKISPSISLVNLLNRASRSFFNYNIDSAKMAADKALQMSVGLKFSKGEADALLNLASFYENKPDYTKGVETCLKSVNTYEKINDQIGLADAYIELAMLYKKIGGDKLLEEYMQESVDYSDKAYNISALAKDTGNMIDALNQAGIVYRDWGKVNGKSFYYDSAFNCYLAALHLADLVPEIKDNYVARLYNNISQVYTEHKQDYNKALDYLFKAVDHNKLHNRYAALSYNYGNISQIYVRINNKEKALEYAKKTLEVSSQMNLPHRLFNAYSQLSQTYEMMGRYDSALFYHKLKVDIGDSLLNIEKTKQIADMQTRYETMQKQSEINSLNSLNLSKTRNIYLLIICLILAAAITAAMVFLYKKVARQKRQLQQQSDKLQWTMKELHHRVKNNMQIVTSLLNLQTYRMKDEASVAALTESKLRVQAMSLIHQQLYQSDDASLVNFKHFVTELVETLMAAYGYGTDNFDVNIQVHEEMLDVDAVLPMGLMVNEILTNSFKYAFAHVERPKITVQLKRNGSQIDLKIGDNGPGATLPSVEKKGKGFGKSLIDAFVKQLHATCEVNGEQGMAYHFIIPYKKQNAA